MARPKGYVLSQEQKDKMAEGKRNRKLGIPKIKKEHKPRGRAKGFTVSDEVKAKQKATREANKNKMITKPKDSEKPFIKLGKWHDGFCLWPILRNTLRPLHRYADCVKIEREIVKAEIWQDKKAIKEILSKYFIFEIKNKADGI